MPNRQQLETALRGAHSAGDANAATTIANALKSYSEPPEEEFDFSIGKMASNIPGSAVEFGKSLATPFLHPIDTAESLVDLAGSGINKLAQQLVESLPEDIVKSGNKLNNYLADLGIPLQRLPEGSEGIEFDTGKVDQVGEFISGRYGSMEDFKKTVQNDPVGVLSDFSMVLTGGGSAAAMLPGKVGKLGQAAKKAGLLSEPINLAKGATKFAASKVIPKDVPVKLFESAAKFSTTFTKEKRTAMAETALEHGIMPTAKGLDKLTGITDKFNTQVTSLIDDATKSGKTIPKKAVFKHLNELRQRVGGTRIGADKNLKQIHKAAKNLDIQLKKTKKTSLTPNELQELKKSAYDDVSFEAKRLRSQAGTEAATKAIGRGAKEAIESVADVKDLNRELGKLLKLKDPLSRSAARIENRNVVSIDAPIKIAAGQAAGGRAGAAAGVGLAILEQPKMKAKLAIKIKEIQDAGKLNLIDHKLLPTLVHYGLLQAGRLPSGDEE